MRVDANRVSRSASGGIPVFASRDVVIVHNTVTASADAAVGLFDASSSSEATDNRLSGNGAGVALDGGASGNRINGNWMAGNAGGVIVDVGTHDNAVFDNAIDGSAFEGIAVVGSDGNLIARNRVARSGGSEAAGGIVVIASPDDPAETSGANVLAGNTALANDGDGIRIAAGQTGNLLRGNEPIATPSSGSTRGHPRSTVAATARPATATHGSAWASPARRDRGARRSSLPSTRAA